MDSYMARPRYAPRRPAAVQKRRRTPQSNGWLKRLIALQTIICIILLLITVIIKGIHISATDFISKQVDYVLDHNVELKSVFSYVENLAADVRSSIAPGSENKNRNGGLLAAEDSQASDGVNRSGSAGNTGMKTGSGGNGAAIKTGSGGNQATMETSPSSQDNPKAGSADTSEKFSNDTGENSVLADDSPDISENSANTSENTSDTNSNVSDNFSEDAAYNYESGIGEALAHPQTSVLAASSDEGIVELPEMTAPAYGSLDTPFGKISGGSSNEDTHNGIDIGLKPGSSVVAAADGEVAEAGISPAYGAFIRITHKGGLQTVYAGCSGFTVQKGAKINRGDVVARIGNSAISVGYHLHFEVWKDGRPVNPLEYISVDAG